MSKKWYNIINYVIAGIILAIIVFAAVQEFVISIKSTTCVHSELLGNTCPTCGLADGISAILKGEYLQAEQIQPNSLSLFLFMVVQLILRATVIVLLFKSRLSLKIVSSLDITLSLILFVWAFKDVIPQAIYIFYKMLLTGNMG